MDPLSATASIAGILSLVAQSINGIERLRRFVKDVHDASLVVINFSSQINAFQACLSQVQSLLVKLSPSQPDIAPALDVLRSRVESCVSDIEKWLDTAEKMIPIYSRGINSFFMKLRVALNKDGISDFDAQVAKHQAALGMSLSVLVPYLTLRGLDRLDKLAADVTKQLQTTTSHLPTGQVIAGMFSENVDQVKAWAEKDLKAPVLEKIEHVEYWARTLSNNSLQDSEDMKSLSDAVSSMSSEISQLRETLSKPRSPTLRTAYSCAAILGIEEAFEENKCIYCGEVLADVNFNWRLRGIHLAFVHGFGCCDMSISYDTLDHEDEFRDHLAKHHGQSVWTSCSRFKLSRGRSRNRDHRLAKVELPVEPGSVDSNTDVHDQTTRKFAEIDTSSGHRGLAIRFCQDIDYIRHCFRRVEVDVSTQCLRDLNPRTLTIFWEIDWRLRCTLERCVINEFRWSHLGRASQQPFSVDVVLTFLSTRSYKYLEKSVEFFRKVYLSDIHEAIPKQTVSTNRDSLEFSSLESRPREADFLDSRHCVQAWLCRVVRESETIQVLASRYSGVVTVEQPQTLSWFLCFIQEWEESAKELNHSGGTTSLLSSHGAVDSRDDLVSERSKIAMEVKSVLGALKLTQYFDRFIEEGFDSWDAICQITEADLVYLGVKPGHRRILQNRILESEPRVSKLLRAIEDDSAASSSNYSPKSRYTSSSPYVSRSKRNIHESSSDDDGHSLE